MTIATAKCNVKCIQVNGFIGCNNKAGACMCACTGVIHLRIVSACNISICLKKIKIEIITGIPAE